MSPVTNPPATDARPDLPTPSGPDRVAASPSRADRRALAGIVLGAALLFLTGLGGIDLWAPDEPRYAAIAEEIRAGEHGAEGLVLLRLDGAPYSQKPPLYFWLAALFGLPGGRVDEVAARLPSALAGIACVAATFAVARRLRFPVATAALAAGLLATSARFVFTARRAQLDVLLAAFELAAILLFLAIETRRGGCEQARRSPWRLAGLHAALGAAGLVKGPVGWLPLLVFAAWLAWEGRAKAIRSLTPPWALALSLGPLALWIGAATALAPEGFAADAVGTNVFARFFAGSSHARPFYYYAYQLPLDFLPWTLLGPFGIAALGRALSPTAAAMPTANPIPSADPPARSTARFIAAWILVPLAFFTLSAGKRGLYLVPILPALALLGALAVGEASGGRGDAASGASSDPDGLRRRRRWLGVRTLAIAIACIAAIELAAALFVLPRLDGEKSPRPIAEAVARQARADESVGVLGLRPLESALGYYGLDRVAPLADERDAREFLGAGGRLVLMRARDYDRLASPLALALLERYRSGRRALVLAQPRALAHPSPSPSTRLE